jgi:hypothetical protein
VHALDLDVPALGEPAHRERDEEDLHRDDEEGDEPEQPRLEQRVRVAGLVAVQPRGRETAAKISITIASAAATGSTPLFQRAMKNAITRFSRIRRISGTCMPASTSHPPMATTASSTAEATSSSRTTAFVALLAARSRLG